MKRVLVAILLAALVAIAQEETIKVDVDVVSLYCVVRDKRNALVTNLTKDQFTVLEDGKPQPIKYFNQETDLPITIGLLIDVSKSQENLIDVEKRAASQFFQKVLGKKDMAFLISFGAEAELLQDYTNSPRLLQRGLDGLRLSVPVGGVGPSPTNAQMRGTILYDAVYLAAGEKLKGEVGRKVIVLITDGVDTGSRVTRNEAMELAQKADAIIYSIYYVDDRMYGSMFGGGGEGELKRLSEETGGRVFRVDRSHTLDDIFTQIQQEVRSQYAIGYTPTNDKKDGTFRKVEIKMANKDLKAQARKGYYASKD